MEAQIRTSLSTRAGADEFRVKGSTINSKFAYVRETFGPSAEERLLQRFESRGAMAILDSSWYSFSLYEDILNDIATTFLGGNLSRLQEVGEFSARKSLRTTYHAFFVKGEIVKALDRLLALHGLLYSHGKTQSAGGGRNSFVILRTGDPFWTEADLWVAAGFYRGVGKLCGHSDVTCRFERRGDSVRYELLWA